jgi:hypothetical protein
MPTPTKPHTQGKRLSLLSFGLFEENLLPTLYSVSRLVLDFVLGRAPWLEYTQHMQNNI